MGSTGKLDVCQCKDDVSHLSSKYLKLIDFLLIILFVLISVLSIYYLFGVYL